jgi:hypothetical protein
MLLIVLITLQITALAILFYLITTIQVSLKFRALGKGSIIKNMALKTLEKHKR